MIPKQDRQGVRKATDIEQKYNLNTDFSKIEKLASDAQRAASAAISKAQDADSSVKKLSEQLDGLMPASVYDPQGKAQDIFAYVDAAILGAIEGSY